MMCRIIEIKNPNFPFSTIILYWLRDVSIQFSIIGENTIHQMSRFSVKKKSARFEVNHLPGLTARIDRKGRRFELNANSVKKKKLEEDNLAEKVISMQLRMFALKQG